MLELLTRVLCDTLPASPADAAFLFGQTPDNQESVFQTAQKLIAENKVKKILLMQTGAISGYPGIEVWKRELMQTGIPESKIAGVPPTDTSILHTLIEAQSMVQHARQQGYQSVVLVASPFQQLRAFMTAVTAAKWHYPELRLYSQPGVALPWTEQVTHSQGKLHGTRSSLIAGELERIEQYQAKGDLASVKEVLDYLNGR